MPIWDVLQNRSGDSDSAAPGAIPQNPIAAQLIESLGPNMYAQLMGTGGGGGATTQQSLADMLRDSAQQVSGRRGITGEDFSGALPPWAKDLSPKVLKHPDYDPYFGVVSQQGDEMVYMGGEKTYRPASSDAGGVPLSTGMSRVDGGQAAGSDGSFDEFYNSGDKKAKTQEPASGSMDEWRSGGQRPREDYAEPKKKKALKGDKTMTAMQAMNLPYTWDEEEVAEYMKRMRQAGINVTSFDGGESSLLGVWQTLVQRAAMTYSMSEGARKVTPWDVLDMYKSEAQANGTFTNYQNGTDSVVRRSVSEITEGQAWDSLRTTVSQMLGRDPSDQELRDYTYRMNQLAAANPSISKTIARYKNGEVVSENTKTTGGFNAGDMAQEAYEDAQGDPEYAEYQSATTYFNAAMSALGAIGQT